jgi:hypothetical protein
MIGTQQARRSAATRCRWGRSTRPEPQARPGGSPTAGRTRPPSRQGLACSRWPSLRRRDTPQRVRTPLSTSLCAGAGLTTMMTPVADHAADRGRAGTGAGALSVGSRRRRRRPRPTPAPVAAFAIARRFRSLFCWIRPSPLPSQPTIKEKWLCVCSDTNGAVAIPRPPAAGADSRPRRSSLCRSADVKRTCVQHIIPVSEGDPEPGGRHCWRGRWKRGESLSRE